MSLIEQDAIRLAKSLDDYGHITVTDIRGDVDNFEIAFTDHRCEAKHVIASHFDYWDFLSGCVLGGSPC
jgi:hypothetical protein